MAPFEDLKALSLRKKALLLLVAVLAAGLSSGLIVDLAFKSQGDAVQLPFFTIGFVAGTFVGLVFFLPSLLYLRWQERRKDQPAAKPPK